MLIYKEKHIPVLLKIFLIYIIICFLPLSAYSLEPEEILVVVNENTTGSVALAEYYMKKRSIPLKNIVKIKTGNFESCSRSTYKESIADPVRKFILSNRLEKKVRCLVLMYGLPLKIATKSPYKEDIIFLENEEKKYFERLKKENPGSRKNIENKLVTIKKKILDLKKGETSASVDSELALVIAGKYPLENWIPNPYFYEFIKSKLIIGKDKVLMVSRLDGPSLKIVKSIIDDTLKAEKLGLKGKAYFDARWVAPEENNIKNYRLYDKYIHNAADRVRKSKRMPVLLNVLGEKNKNIKYRDVALYCGWQASGQKIDSISWQKGAVGYRLSSNECSTLKSNENRAGCKIILEKGAVVTTGSVGEAYLQSLPVPEVFFDFLVDGYLTVVECYMLSNPFLSWQMVLIGDPLYRPFMIHRK
ncbi:MAG: TIGR03790 family protein [Desulfobacterales bacterium]|jgi:uncharacterized protein (TIGR03790 family)|nr:TIGR03790 family protein [Desulfobacteraceae bacterium]MBT4363342.1 TIGR03790 family protein [Desulfobacteraceae bacterium]MBT7085848.1 TIGR03790 family protein [Desulfobacterales bacterium]